MSGGVAGVTAFYLGTHMPDWLGKTAVPLFVSRRRLADRRTLPRAVGPWALDSGGFSELSLFGAWTVAPIQYVGEVRRFAAGIGGLAWAAAQDWMCEPFIFARTGLDVAEHQRRTIANFLELRELAPELPWTPVLQGWRAEDYLRHADQYAAAGVDLRAAPVVGLGTVCRRQHTAEAEGVVRRLASTGLRLHGFGFKVRGLERIGPLMASADSMAWSFRARREGRRLCTSGRHATCANCLDWALAWRGRILPSLLAPTQLSLMLEAS